ncbi:hypothetical protein LWC34_28495 [Kibdelosporangium philippinense]|uniref:DUF1876 domain-containing protein n=1 Tax=Kibdelosporangium philippinense TaxID=211113 RepID=A0ABS8ZGQ9_9PSEU|nr:hypothetical protein [Kibdelosporangium philippinense]MCE7006737.1 hypothetical protein [Kibdelosporangium philippinense]
MSFYVVIRPQVGDEVRVVAEPRDQVQLVAELGTACLSVQVDRREPGGPEVAALFARQLAAAALRFAKYCDEVAKPVDVPEVLPLVSRGATNGAVNLDPVQD